MEPTEQKFDDPDLRIAEHMPVVVRQGDGPHDYTMQCTCGHTITLEGELRRLSLKDGDLVVYRGNGDEMRRFCSQSHPELPKCPVLTLHDGNEIERHSREEIIEESSSYLADSDRCSTYPTDYTNCESMDFGEACAAIQKGFVDGALWMREHLVTFHRDGDK